MGWLQRIVNRPTESGTDTSHHRSDQQPSPGVIPPPRTASTEISVSTALSLAGVYRAVSLLSCGASQLTIDVWRKTTQISTPQWIRRPDVKSHLSAFLEETVVSLATRGNAYWRIIRDNPASTPDALIVLDPTEVVFDETKGVYSHKGKELRDWQISHLKLLRVPGAVYGLGPIQAARAELTGALAVRDYAADWFDAGDVPSGILKSDQMLNADDAQRYKEQWRQGGAGEVKVLGQGLNYTPIMLSPKDAQFIESRRFSITEIARMFGIPAHHLLAAVEGSSMTYLNVADADLTFVRWTLTQYLREIEEAITVLLPRGQTARFNLDAVLRPATKDRYEAHRVGVEAQFLTINEVRAIEGLDPLPEPAKEDQ